MMGVSCERVATAKVLRPNLCLKHLMAWGMKPAFTINGHRSFGS